MAPHGPIARELEELLREAVILHRAVPLRRRHPVTVHVGTPGASTHAYAAVPGDDDGLRRDLVAAMLARCEEGAHVPLGWLTRSGSLSLHDEDVTWAAAVHGAYAERGLECTFVVVTRQGWYDPRSGHSRTWVRLRRHAR